jgi:hypothetical protein
MKKIDMSERAISKRLKQTEQLRKLSLSLMKAKRIYAKGEAIVDSIEQKEDQPDSPVDRHSK